MSRKKRVSGPASEGGAFWLKTVQILLIILLLATLQTGCVSQTAPETSTLLASTTASAELLLSPAATPADSAGQPDINGHYTSPEDVAAYLYTYEKLPANYITKSQAAKLGWDASRGNLWDVTDKKSIGGDRFGNREGLLPDADGRIWYECDVNYHGGYRGAERLVYSNDGLVYYTGDHYQSFKIVLRSNE